MELVSRWPSFTIISVDNTASYLMSDVQRKNMVWKILINVIPIVSNCWYVKKLFLKALLNGFRVFCCCLPGKVYLSLLMNNAFNYNTYILRRQIKRLRLKSHKSSHPPITKSCSQERPRGSLFVHKKQVLTNSNFDKREEYTLYVNMINSPKCTDGSFQLWYSCPNLNIDVSRKILQKTLPRPQEN